MIGPHCVGFQPPRNREADKVNPGSFTLESSDESIEH